MIVYGIDPEASRVSYLRVDSNGFPEDRVAVLRGNTLFPHAHGVNTAAGSFGDRVHRICAGEDPRSLRVTIEVRCGSSPPTVTDLFLAPLTR